MDQIPKDEASRSKLQVLFFQLSEILNDPPIVIDLADWRDNVDNVMMEIGDLSPFMKERLEDLVREAVRRAEVHVDDLDSDASPNEIEKSHHEYFTQVAFVSSEINALKSL